MAACLGRIRTVGCWCTHDPLTVHMPERRDCDEGDALSRRYRLRCAMHARPSVKLLSRAALSLPSVSR